MNLVLIYIKLVFILVTNWKKIHYFHTIIKMNFPDLIKVIVKEVLHNSFPKKTTF